MRISALRCLVVDLPALHWGAGGTHCVRVVCVLLTVEFAGDLRAAHRRSVGGISVHFREHTNLWFSGRT